MITVLRVAAVLVPALAAVRPCAAQPLAREAFPVLRPHFEAESAARSRPLRIGAAIPSDVLRAASPPPTYWLEGGVIGGVGLALGTFALVGGLCHYSDSGYCNAAKLALTFTGGAAGFVVGALIGGQVPKHGVSPAPPPN